MPLGSAPRPSTSVLCGTSTATHRQAPGLAPGGALFARGDGHRRLKKTEIFARREFSPRRTQGQADPPPWVRQGAGVHVEGGRTDKDSLPPHTTRPTAGVSVAHAQKGFVYHTTSLTAHRQGSLLHKASQPTSHGATKPRLLPVLSATQLTHKRTRLSPFSSFGLGLGPQTQTLHQHPTQPPQPPREREKGRRGGEGISPHPAQVVPAFQGPRAGFGRKVLPQGGFRPQLWPREGKASKALGKRACCKAHTHPPTSCDTPRLLCWVRWLCAVVHRHRHIGFHLSRQ